MGDKNPKINKRTCTSIRQTRVANVLPNWHYKESGEIQIIERGGKLKNPDFLRWVSEWQTRQVTEGIGALFSLVQGGYFLHFDHFIATHSWNILVYIIFKLFPWLLLARNGEGKMIHSGIGKIKKRK